MFMILTTGRNVTYFTMATGLNIEPPPPPRMISLVVRGFPNTGPWTGAGAWEVQHQAAKTQ